MSEGQIVEDHLKKSIKMFKLQKELEEFANECARRHVNWLLETSNKNGMLIDNVSDLFNKALKPKSILTG